MITLAPNPMHETHQIDKSAYMAALGLLFGIEYEIERKRQRREAIMPLLVRRTAPHSFQSIRRWRISITHFSLEELVKRLDEHAGAALTGHHHETNTSDG